MTSSSINSHIDVNDDLMHLKRRLKSSLSNSFKKFTRSESSRSSVSFQECSSKLPIGMSIIMKRASKVGDRGRLAGASEAAE